MYFERQNYENNETKYRSKIPSALASMAQNRDIRRFTNNSVALSPQAVLGHERSDSYSPIEESDRIGHGPTFVV